MGIWLFITSWNVPGSGTVPLSTCVADLTVGGFCFELCNEVSSLERLLPVIGALVGKMGGLFANLSINKERGILSTTIGRTHNMDKKLSNDKIDKDNNFFLNGDVLSFITTKIMIIIIHGQNVNVAWVSLIPGSQSSWLQP